MTRGGGVWVSVMIAALRRTGLFRLLAVVPVAVLLSVFEESSDPIAVERWLSSRSQSEVLGLAIDHRRPTRATDEGAKTGRCMGAAGHRRTSPHPDGRALPAGCPCIPGDRRFDCEPAIARWSPHWDIADRRRCRGGGDHRETSGESCRVGAGIGRHHRGLERPVPSVRPGGRSQSNDIRDPLHDDRISILVFVVLCHVGPLPAAVSDRPPTSQ